MPAQLLNFESDAGLDPAFAFDPAAAQNDKNPGGYGSAFPHTVSESDLVEFGNCRRFSLNLVTGSVSSRIRNFLG